MAAGTSPALNAEWNLAHSVGAVFLVAVLRSSHALMPTINATNIRST